MPEQDPDVTRNADGDAVPTVNQPLNAKKRPTARPVILLLAFLLGLVLLYFLIMEVLVPAG